VIGVEITQRAGTGWREVYLGGSKEAEDEMIRRRLAPAVNSVQRDIRRLQGQSRFKRAQHGKLIAATKNARFEVLPGIPEDLQAGLFRPGKQYTAHVRFSNASSIEMSDASPDLRGLAVRVFDDDGEEHDFLMTNAPFSHVRDARQFMIVLSAVTRQAGPTALWKLQTWRTVVGVVRIARRLGPGEALRVARTIRGQTYGQVASLATEQYWSRAPFAFGPVAVKFMLDSRAVSSGPAAPDLRAELKSRLSAGDVAFDFKVQRFVDEAKTPIEDATVEWKEEASPLIPIARLVIPMQELDPAGEAGIERYEFNPWNGASDDYKPLGSMNRARKMVYQASAKLRREG
jgi:hypothetical protein